jgi:hypothetical protein
VRKNTINSLTPAAFLLLLSLLFSFVPSSNFATLHHPCAADALNMVTTNGTANGNPRKGLVEVSIALRPNDPERVPGLIQDIAATGDALKPDDGASRLQLLEKARDLVRALETPRETMIKHCWAEPSCLMALSIGVNIGLFHHMVKNGDRSKKAGDLAKTLGIHPPLLCKYRTFQIRLTPPLTSRAQVA